MKSRNIVGIIAEYNPFHNGHLYHLNKVKELFPNSLIVLVVGGNFTQRGDLSLLSKWEKTNIALEYDIDLIVELPFPFNTESADNFALGSIQILKALKVNYLVFGSESNDISSLTKAANLMLNNKKFNQIKDNYLKEGLNYPTALNKALNDLGATSFQKPNDLLGLSYIKEIIKQQANIIPISIERTDDYLLTGTEIRNNLNSNNLKNLVPNISYNYLKVKKENNCFSFLKYQILTNNNLKENLLVDEGLENKIIKEIDKVNNIDDLINALKSKRYTYNRLKRMLLYILLNFTKENKNNNINVKYIRVLGFNNNGQNYLKTIKKDLELPIITNINNSLLTLEIKVDKIFCYLNNLNYTDYIKGPIQK